MILPNILVNLYVYASILSQDSTNSINITNEKILKKCSKLFNGINNEQILQHCQNFLKCYKYTYQEHKDMREKFVVLLSLLLDKYMFEISHEQYIQIIEILDTRKDTYQYNYMQVNNCAQSIGIKSMPDIFCQYIDALQKRYQMKIPEDNIIPMQDNNKIEKLISQICSGTYLNPQIYKKLYLTIIKNLEMINPKNKKLPTICHKFLIKNQYTYPNSIKHGILKILYGS